MLRRSKSPIVWRPCSKDILGEKSCMRKSGGRSYILCVMLPDISREFLTRMMEGNPVGKVQVNVAEGEFGYGFD